VLKTQLYRSDILSRKLYILNQVREGKSGAGRPALSAGLAAAIDTKWTDVVGQATGCSTYAQLRQLAAHERQSLQKDNR